MEKFIIFTDLDGTLLDHATYSFEAALPALDLIRQSAVPLIICSSKTKAEIEYYRKQLANDHPFVSENGGGIFIPKNYFNFQLAANSHKIERESAYEVIRLGARYADLRNAVKELQLEGFDIAGFGDMSPEELSDIAGLKRDEAVMAQERYFDEPFTYKGPHDQLAGLINSIEKKGFNFTQGKFFHILGNSDKGKAIALLTELYKKQFNAFATIAIGDSLNDLPMLEKVDYPVLVRKTDGGYDPRINVPRLMRADGIGPEGWNKAVMILTEMLTGR